MKFFRLHFLKDEKPSTPVKLPKARACTVKRIGVCTISCIFKLYTIEIARRRAQDFFSKTLLPLVVSFFFFRPSTDLVRAKIFLLFFLQNRQRRLGLFVAGYCTTVKSSLVMRSWFSRRIHSGVKQSCRFDRSVPLSPAYAMIAIAECVAWERAGIPLAFAPDFVEEKSAVGIQICRAFIENIFHTKP